MADYDDLLENYASKAAQEIPPVQKRLADALDVADDDEKLKLIGGALAELFMRGVEAGEAEIQAQTAEQGFNITTTKLRASPPEDEARE